MKRTVLLIVLVGIASFGLGAVAKLKYPWASVKLNRTVTMTVLEKELLTSGQFFATEPLESTAGIGRQKYVVVTVSQIAPVIIAQGIRLDIAITIRKGANRSQSRSGVERALKIARKRWVDNSPKLSRVPLWIHAFSGGKLVGVMEDDKNYATVFDG